MYSAFKDILDSINSIKEFQRHNLFAQMQDINEINQGLLTQSTLDMVNSMRISTDEILASLKLYNRAALDFKVIDFSSLISSQIHESTQVIEKLRQSIFDFTTISNKLNFDYLKFYSSRYDFSSDKFFDPGDEEIDQKYIQEIEIYEQVRETKIGEIKSVQPEILITFKQNWYEILDKLKSSTENWYHKQINKFSLKEPDIQTGIASHLEMLERVLNVGGVFFRFEKEPVVSENGRVDFIFKFTSPFREAAVEIKIIDNVHQLDSYGSKQLLDYMERRNYKEGIRLVFNKTQQEKECFEKDNIIHYFINLNQPISSSLNK